MESFQIIFHWKLPVIHFCTFLSKMHEREGGGNAERDQTDERNGSLHPPSLFHLMYQCVIKTQLPSLQSPEKPPSPIFWLQFTLLVFWRAMKKNLSRKGVQGQVGETIILIGWLQEAALRKWHLRKQQAEGASQRTSAREMSQVKRIANA